MNHKWFGRGLASPSKIRTMIATIVQDRVGDRATAALFGSIARGEATTHSEIDLALVLPDNIHSDDREVLLDDLHDTIEPYTGNTLQIIDATRSELQRMVAKNAPLIHSWAADAQTIAGVNLTTLILGRPL